MITKNLYTAIDLIKYPLITDKAAILIEKNQYTFIVDSKATKFQIKQAIEFLFNVKTIKINTCNLPPKKCRIGRYSGLCAKYKKAMVTLEKNARVNIFSEI